MSKPASLDDYVDVAERIVAFKEQYPDGSLQTLSWQDRKIGDQIFIVYQAVAYRHPHDDRPGHGTAWEPFPGTTPYTRNSELMNAETAAWGRAIVALGIVANRTLASKQEVRARVEEQAPALSDEDILYLKGQAAGLRMSQILHVLTQCGVPLPPDGTSMYDVFNTVPPGKLDLVAEALADVPR